MNAEKMFEMLKKALDEGKVIELMWIWTGSHVVGNREYNNVNIRIRIDEETIYNEDFPNDECDMDFLCMEFYKLERNIYSMLRKEAHKLLCEKLGFQNLQEMKSKAEVFGDDSGNRIVRLENGNIYAAIYSHYHRIFYPEGNIKKDIDIYVYHKPKIMELIRIG